MSPQAIAATERDIGRFLGEGERLSSPGLFRPPSPAEIRQAQVKWLMAVNAFNQLNPRSVAAQRVFDRLFGLGEKLGLVAASVE